METRVDEIADSIDRLSLFIPEFGPRGFTHNLFLIDTEEPLLFSTVADPLPYPDASDDTDRRLDREAPPAGMPRWVKVFGIAFLVLIVLIAITPLYPRG